MSEFWWESKGFTDEDIVTHNRCPVCESREIHKYVPPPAYADVPWQICAMCKYIMQTPYPSMESMERFYQSDYRTDVSGDYPNAHDDRIQKMRATRQLEAYHRARGKVPSAMLDIGAANGRLLQGFAGHYPNLRIMAVEYNQRDNEIMEERGIPHTDDYQAVEGRYDLVAMSHVLEHIDLPVEYLIDIRERLATPQAWMLIETPSTASNSAYQSFHFGVYSWLSTAIAFTRAGWVPVMVEQTTKNLQTCVARLA